MTEKYLKKKSSTSLAIRKENAENQNYFEIFILHVSEWPRSTKQVAAHAGKNVEQGETLLHGWWDYRLVQLLWKSMR